MVWVYASPHPTQVIELEAIGNGTNNLLVQPAVRAVTVVGQASPPQPTSVLIYLYLNQLGRKFFVFVHVDMLAHIYRPSMALSISVVAWSGSMGASGAGGAAGGGPAASGGRGGSGVGPGITPPRAGSTAWATRV